MAHIMVWRGCPQEDGVNGFWHHGILCSGGTIIHYTGMEGAKTLYNARILETDMCEFQGSDNARRIHYVRHARGGAAEHVEARARSRIGGAGYNLLFHNCETFARWCVYGQPSPSFQAAGALIGAAAGIASLAFGGGLAGAVLTAIVAHKFWDRVGNRSAHRETPEQMNGGRDRRREEKRD